MTLPTPGVTTSWGTQLNDHIKTLVALNVRDHGAAGDGVADDTVEIQDALTTAGAAAALGVKTVHVPAGTFKISSPLSVPAGVELWLDAGATISNTVETQSAVILAANSTLRGGKVLSPAVFDYTTGPWTYAVVYVTGDGAEVDGVTLENVPHLGIGIKEVNDARVTNCRILGNYPAASYTGVETGHYGIAVDVGTWATSNSGSGVVIANNIIQTCIQGIAPVNHGSGVGYGCVIVGNRFYGCHNHGVYSQIGVTANTITGNVFFYCQKPVVTVGASHVIANNTMHSIGTGTQRDQAGISCRDAEDCVIEGNTILGESTSTNIAIQLDQSSTDTTRRNTIRGNTIQLSGSGGQPAIRVGNASTTVTNRDNRVEGNIIQAPGPNATSGGVIEFVMSGTNTGSGNVVEGNTLICTANSAHVRMARQRYASVRDNYLRHDADAGSSTTIIQVRLEVVTDSIVEGNVCVVTSVWGANTTMHAIREMDSSCDRNVLGPNVIRHDLTKVVSSTEVVQSVPGNASLIGQRVGEHASATTLGSVTGKVEVRDGKGAILGYLPVYGSIT
jgi:hypothetical protein